MINNVVLTGRLTRDVDVRFTQSGTAVGSFSLAVERNFKNAQGERETDFINCVIWKKSAENLAKFTSKGSLIGVEGNIQTRNYENQQGQRVYVTEVLVNNFSLLESKKDSGQQTNNYYQQKQSDPFAGKQSSFGINDNTLTVSDDDIPF
jgi:single-strand DNA-binding protein